MMTAEYFRKGDLMNLENALREFMSSRQRGYSAADQKCIYEVVNFLGLNNVFEVKDDYVTDPEQVIHIHPRMIVASRPFPGSINRGSRPYPVHTHFRKLSGWK